MTVDKILIYDCSTILCQNSFSCQSNFDFLVQKKIGFQFTEAECLKIDAENKKVYCRSHLKDEENEFVVDYDYLVISVGANVNTFNTPGVKEHCHFLKVTS